MFKLNRVKFGRYGLKKVTSFIFFFIQLLNFHREKRANYGIEIFEYFYLPWNSEKDFNNIYNEIKNNTLNPKSRLYTIYSFANKYLTDGGSFIEVGTWKGGVPGLISKIPNCKGIDVYVCDTFKGVVNAGDNDSYFKNGEYNDTNKKFVEEIVDKKNCNLKIVEGVFPESFEKIDNFKDFSLAHIDVDTYISAKKSFNFIYKNLKKGGVIVLDDFGGWFTDGVTKFGNELIRSKDYFAVPNHLGQLIIYKYK